MKIRKILLLFLTFWLIGAVVCFGSETKILLIGIDAFTWNVINPLVRENRLPNTAKLIKRGIYGNLESFSDFPASPAIWTSIATGKSINKHGIESFAIWGKSMREWVPVRSYHRKTKAIWSILSENKKTVGIIDWLVTWPPEKVNGFMVSSLLTSHPEAELAITYPQGLQSELLGIVRDVGVPPKGFDYIRDKLNWDEKITECEHHLSKLEKVSLWLQKKEKVDFFALYTPTSDWLQHVFWKFMEPEKFREKIWELYPNDIAKYKDVIKNFYQEIDGTIGKVLLNIDRNTIVIIVSDHGAKDTPAPRVYFDFKKILEILEKANLISNVYSVDPRSCDFWTSLKIDFEHSSEEYKIQEERISQLFSDIFLDSDRKRVFPQILKKEQAHFPTDATFPTDFDIEIYADSDIARLFGQNKYIHLTGERYPLDGILYFDNISGVHALNGVVIIAGKNIRKDVEINGASVLDITPTILYLMGLPVAKDMDGKVLTQAIEPSFLEKNPIRYIESYDKEEKRKEIPGKEEITPYDEELLKRLKALGYIQ